MGLFRRKTTLRVLVLQLDRIGQALQAIEQDPAHLPSPADMKALAIMGLLLPHVSRRVAGLEDRLWERIELWRNTPWTPAQRRRRRLTSFIGWWLAVTFTLASSLLGWLAFLLPSPWHMLAASGVIALLALVALLIREKYRPDG